MEYMVSKCYAQHASYKYGGIGSYAAQHIFTIIEATTSAYVQTHPIDPFLYICNGYYAAAYIGSAFQFGIG